MSISPKGKFEEIYMNEERGKLSKDGKEYLDNDPKIKSKKIDKLFWKIFGIIIAVLCAVSVLIIWNLLMDTKKTANMFENNRNENFMKILEDK